MIRVALAFTSRRAGVFCSASNLFEVCTALLRIGAYQGEDRPEIRCTVDTTIVRAGP